MKGDFSSPTTIDPTKHYSGVLSQQGRVWLDSDWNQDVLERLHLLQQETADLIGCCGVPEPGTAFRISANPDHNAPEDDFQIEGGPGRLGHCYVGGILCQNDANTSYLNQADLPDAPRIDLSAETVTALVYLEVWQRLITYLEDEEVREVALGGPDTATRIKTVAQVKVVVLPEPPLPLVNTSSLIFIGSAEFAADARRDIAAAFPNYPFQYRAGWGYQLQTDVLPNSSGAGAPGNGTYKLHAIAFNKAGLQIDLGTKTITVESDTGLDLSPGVSPSAAALPVTASARAVAPSAAELSTIASLSPGPLIADPSGIVPSAQPFGGILTTDQPFDPVIVTAKPALTVNRKALNFGFNGSLITNSQTVLVIINGGSGVAWTATSDHPNITVTPGSGTGTGSFQVSATSGSSGIITVTAPGTTGSPQTIQVNVAAATSTFPFGLIDTPVNGTTGVSGAIPVTGWALDSIEVTRVDILREPVTGESSSSLLPPSCAKAVAHLPQASLGTLTTLQPTDTQPADPCKLPDPGNFTGRENHLYRIEIHEGGNVAGVADASFPVKLRGDHAAGARLLDLSGDLPQIWIDALRRSGGASLSADNGQTERISVSAVSNPRTLVLDRPLRQDFPASKQPTLTVGIARFKWSRDNASFAVRVTNIDSSRQILTLSSIARDQATALREGDLVEICDDATELGPGRGFLTQLTADPDPDLFTAPIADPLPPNFHAGAGDRHIILRRWDGVGLAGNLFDLAATPDLDLGDGVHVQFGGSGLLPGDYWQFTARAIDGSVQALVNEPPQGIVRRFSPLAVVRWTAHVSSPPSSPPHSTFSVVHDCRCVFPPLCQPGIHITDVAGISDTGVIATLPNDKAIPVTAILNGINIICDGLVTPADISRAVCFVTVDVAFPGGPGQIVGAYQRIVVAANVSASGNVIHWRPRNKKLLTQLPFHLATAKTAPGDLGILARLVLNGNYIWDPETSRYLDGDAFGVARSATDHSTDWRHPSGNGARGGNFEMWFWLKPPAQAEPFTFQVAAKPNNVRWEGFNELVGDIVVSANGGTPTDPVPTFNIVIDAAPYEIASPQLNPGGRIDVVLLIDEPTSFGFGGFSRRLFLGERISPTSTTSVLFQNVPLQATEFGETRTLQFRNLRLNLADVFVPSAPLVIPILGPGTLGPAIQSAQLSGRSASSPASRAGSISPQTGVSINIAPPAPQPISVSVTITETSTGSQTVVVKNSPVKVAVPLPGVSITAVPNTGQTLPLHIDGNVGINPNLLSNPQNLAVPASFHLQFTEGFPAAFRSRKTPIAAPAGQRLQESGFEDPHALYSIGNAETGARCRAVFENIPEGVQIFVTAQDVKAGATSPAPAQARLAPTDVFEGGAGSVPNPSRFVPDSSGPVSDGVPLLAVPVADGVGVVEWEWVAQGPATQPVLFGVVAAALPGLKIAGNIGVRAGLAPVAEPAVPSFTERAFHSLGRVISVTVSGTGGGLSTL